MSSTLAPRDFLKTSGAAIKNNSGAGAVVNLRGTNLGGWLLHEGWMSPAGELALDRSGWVASASSTLPGESPERALDGDPHTRWSSGVAQASGHWFEVDMRAPTTFDQISLDAGLREEEQLGGFRVEVSSDRRHWQYVAGGSGCGRAVVISTNYQTARYVRVTLDSGKPNPWSIADFSVYVSDEYTLRRTLERRFGTATAERLIAGYHDTWIQETDLDSIKGLGMNVVRVPIYWELLMNLDGTMKPDAEAFRKLDWIVAESASRGIYVILDLHGAPGGHCPWHSCGRAGTNQLWAEPSYQDWTVQIWRRLAARYNGNPAVAAYDLLNEPLLSMGEVENADQIRRKFDFFDRLYRAIREIDHDHIIMIAAFFGWEQALPPSEYGWTNVVYQTHHYDFAHQDDWHGQHSYVTAVLQELSTQRAAWNVPVYAGEFWFSTFDDLYATFLSGLNAMNASWTNWTYKVKNAPDARGADGVRQGVNWGFYSDNPHPVPDINRDDAATIAAKWGKFATRYFQPNTALQDIFRMYATQMV